MRAYERKFWDAANRVMPIVGETERTLFDSSNSTIARFKVNAGDYVIVSLSTAAHGGALRGTGKVPTVTDPLWHAGLHDFTVPEGCDAIAFAAPLTGTTNGYAWVWITPRLVRDDYP